MTGNLLEMMDFCTVSDQYYLLMETLQYDV